MKIGVRIKNMVDIAANIEKIAGLGFHSCQLNSFDTSCYTDETVRIVLEACAKHDVTISTFWAGWSGPRVWNFTEGPTTLGLLPEQYRATRVADLKAGADFAKKTGCDPDRHSCRLYPGGSQRSAVLSDDGRHPRGCAVLQGSGTEVPV